MEFKYSEEAIKEKEYLVSLELTEKGFDIRKCYIKKTTKKKVFFTDFIGIKEYRNQLFYDEIGGKIEHVATASGTGKLKNLYVYKAILLFEEDVQIAREEIKRLALEKIEILHERLNQQTKILEES